MFGMKAPTLELGRLKSAFSGRQKPSTWVREDLHPVDLEDATDFVRDIEAGNERSILFQSAIPYFAFLSDEARLFLLPDLLSTLIAYPHEVVTQVCHFEDERGKALLISLTPAELEAVTRFIDCLSDWQVMRPYLDRIKELACLAEEIHTSQMQ